MANYIPFSQNRHTHTPEIDFWQRHHENSMEGKELSTNGGGPPE